MCVCVRFALALGIRSACQVYCDTSGLCESHLHNHTAAAHRVVHASSVQTVIQQSVCRFSSGSLRLQLSVSGSAGGVVEFSVTI